MAEAQEDKKIWEQRPGESFLWYSRFHKYMLAGQRGIKRSLLLTYQAYRVEQAKRGKGMPLKSPGQVPHTWSKMFKEWNWAARAEAFDKHELERRMEEYEEERIAERAVRREMLRGLRGKILSGIASADPSEMTMTQATNAFLAVLEAQRSEYDDLPTHRQQMSGADGKNIRIDVVYKEKEVGE